MIAPFAIRTTPGQKTCPRAGHKCSLPTDRLSRTLPHDERPRNGNSRPFMVVSLKHVITCKLPLVQLNHES